MVTTTTTYTIEKLDRYRVHLPTVKEYLFEVAPQISAMFDNKLDYRHTPIEDLAENYDFFICRRNGVITGHLICYIFTSPLDITKKILYQLAFYAKPDSGRTAWHLFQKFIDIGRKDANHIITMLTSRTNIKPSTLKNLGFEELETLYRLEIK